MPELADRRRSRTAVRVRYCARCRHCRSARPSIWSSPRSSTDEATGAPRRPSAAAAAFEPREGSVGRRSVVRRAAKSRSAAKRRAMSESAAWSTGEATRSAFALRVEPYLVQPTPTPTGCSARSRTPRTPPRIRCSAPGAAGVVQGRGLPHPATRSRPSLLKINSGARSGAADRRRWATCSARTIRWASRGRVGWIEPADDRLGLTARLRRGALRAARASRPSSPQGQHLPPRQRAC